MKTNYHTHTTRCQHATGNDEDYVLSAIKGGYDEIGFSDHTPWQYRTKYISSIRMTLSQISDYVNSIHALQEKYKKQIKIRLGLEAEYFPDYIYWLKNIIKKYNIEYVIFGNHCYDTDEKFPLFFSHTDSKDMLDLYEESSIEGIESGIFAYMAHPDLFMNSYPEFDQHCAIISRHICRAAAHNNVPLEYNISTRAKNDVIGKTSNIPCPEFWHIAKKEDCTAIIGIDAHNNKDLETDKYYNEAVKELKRIGINTIDRLTLKK